MQAHYQFLDSLKEAFSSYTKPLRDEILSKVTTWRWATASQAQLELFSQEISRTPKGRWLKETPINPGGYVKIGLDQAANILIEYDLSNGYDRYYQHEPEAIVAFELNRENKLNRVEKLLLVEGKPQWYGSYSDNGRANSADRYHHEHGRVTRIESLWLYPPHTQTPTYYIHYNALGSVEFVRRVDPVSRQFPHGQDVEVFREKRISSKELTQSVIQETVSAVMATLQNAAIQQPCYCLMLVVFDAFGRDDWFPPMVAVGLDRERHQWKMEPDRQWVPRNFQYAALPLEGKRLHEYARLFMQDCELKSKYGLPRQVLKKIAKALRAEGIEKILPVTDDFVIVPFDYDTPLVKDCLKGVYSANELKQLATKGLVLE
jgi:hypothetical protein